MVSGESRTLVEEFLIRRRLGRIAELGITARQAEAFAILEEEFCHERAARWRASGVQHSKRG
jgi:hypothetical protein